MMGVECWSGKDGSRSGLATRAGVTWDMRGAEMGVLEGEECSDSDNRPSFSLFIML